MMRSLYSGVSGLKTHQTKMDVIGNNIANVNTVAFKSSSTTFSEIMYQTISSASGATQTKGGINAKQIGLGVTTGSTSVNITSPGATQTTGDAFDLKITGDSFFIVNNGTENLFTKAGAFYIDGAGNLATKANGYNVMGWQVDPATGTIKKDTVSALRIMQEKNLTSSPEATTDATCGGILDANNTNVNSANGYTMNLNFYDALGYSYTAKFAIKTSNPDTKTYTIELSDILDSTNHSILNDYLDTTIPGNAAHSMADIFGQQQSTNVTKNLATGYANITPGTTGTVDKTLNDGTVVTLTYDTNTGNYVGNNNGTQIVSTPQEIYGLSTEEQANFDPANIQADGTYQYTQLSYSYELDYDENTGLFNYIGAAGNNTQILNMSALGGNFADITIDFSTTKNMDNSGKCTMDIDTGNVNDSTLGKGKKLGALTGLQVAENGEIYGSYDNGNTVLLGQIAVAVFSNPSGLEKVGDNCYQKTLNSGEFDGIGQDITADGGKMNSGVLEMSNVDLSTEFTEMITTQRGFQANSRIITTSDTLLEELINLKR
ncbi:flagellar hook protein FlgE [Roseburia sp. 499]|uniref:flagellar hook protein FlgE n=1 Tax=Roseburia sp. 499 TaxID=1261634 RepID=UPI000951BCA9|nr:flagellar hook-basal body complex protein [Roseburia sp. 499]WVK71220.1 flagellar hook-basal body complex protein [Roseburia sp. 499]